MKWNAANYVEEMLANKSEKKIDPRFRRVYLKKIKGQKKSLVSRFLIGNEESFHEVIQSFILSLCLRIAKRYKNEIEQFFYIKFFTLLNDFLKIKPISFYILIASYYFLSLTTILITLEWIFQLTLNLVIPYFVNKF